MIDEYTREYDERQKAIGIQNKIKSVAEVAARFGCETSLVVKNGEGDMNINIYLPNGKLFHRFNKLATAVAWAERWKQDKR